MKHTPGPWEIQDGQYIHAVAVKGSPCIATSPQPHEWREADARLIAAAPEMLNNLKEILKSLVACEMVDASGCEGVSELWIGWIREIISEAEGE
jgi:hypothetical protein